jgi:hypothetical protein
VKNSLTIIDLILRKMKKIHIKYRKKNLVHKLRIKVNKKLGVYLPIMPAPIHGQPQPPNQPQLHIHGESHNHLLFTGL